MRKKLVLLIGIIGIVAISSFSIGYILISNSSPNDDIVLEYDYNVYPDALDYAKKSIDWGFNYNIGEQGIYYGDYYVRFQTVNMLVVIMNQHQWAIYENLVYYRDEYGKIFRHDILWANYVDAYILSIGETIDNGTWNVPNAEIWCLDFWILNVGEISERVFFNDSSYGGWGNHYYAGFY